MREPLQNIRLIPSDLDEKEKERALFNIFDILLVPVGPAEEDEKKQNDKNNN